MKSPEQILFDATFRKIMQLGYAVYDYLPPQQENVDYPFVVVGNVSSAGEANKTTLFNRISIHIDVWGSRNDRIDVTNITNTIYKELVNGIQDDEVNFRPRYNDNSLQYMQDTSIPNQIFNRGMLDLAYRY